MTEFDSVVRPGGTGKITAALDTSHYTGPVAKSIRVKTNDPALDGFILTLAAEVVRPITVSPRDMVSIVGKVEDLKPTELTIEAADGKPFQVTRLETDKWLLATVAPKDPSAHYVLTIRARPDTPVGRATATVTLVTSNARAPRVPIRVSMTVLGSVKVMPDRVYFTPSATVQHVKLVKVDDPALKIVGIDSSDPAVKVTQTANGRETDLALTYTGPPGRTLNAKVTVRTGEPRQREIVIPVLGRP